MKILSELINGIECHVINKTNIEIANIYYDSRKVTQSSLFFCIIGQNTNGHKYIDSAIKNGAVAIVCSKDWLEIQEKLDSSISWIGVENLDLSLALIASNFYENTHNLMNFIGITGTNGKTTTAHIIEFILNQSESTTGMIGTLYYRLKEFSEKAQFTSPFPPELHKLLSKMKQLSAKNIVMECSSHALHQHRIDPIKFACAIFTNLTQDHLDYHKNMENYFEAKMYLFNHLIHDEGKCVINIDDPYSPKILEQIPSEKTITYGINESADFRAINIKNDSNGLSFSLGFKGKTYPVSLHLIGHFNVMNSLAALASTSQFIPLEKAIRHLENFKGIPGRFERVTPLNSPFTVIVDYAHTPDSLKNLLKTARDICDRHLICVFGCGGDRDTTKRPLMGSIAEKLSNLAIVTSDNPRSENPDKIIKDILMGMDKNIGTIIQSDRKRAISQAILYAREGDVVVIAGKGHEDYQILKDKTIFFDDRLEAKRVLETLCQQPF